MVVGDTESLKLRDAKLVCLALRSPINGVICELYIVIECIVVVPGSTLSSWLHSDAQLRSISFASCRRTSGLMED